MKLKPRSLEAAKQQLLSTKFLRKALCVKRKAYTKKCSLSGCKGRAPAQRVFKFPSNLQQARAWRKLCGFPAHTDVTNKRVCERHFCKEYTQGKYLPKTTVPTLNLPRNIVEEKSDEESGDDNADTPDHPLTDYKLDLFDDVDPSEIEVYKSFVSTVNKVVTRKSHCTTCDIHIGTAPINEAIIKMHPLLRVTLCKKCFTFYNTGGFESGEDGSELYCRWCGQGGELYCCSNCPYVFCHNCITLNFPKKMVNEIQNIEHWKCFVCNPTCLMILRADHWALLNFIEKQKLDVLNISTDETEINNRMSKDVSKCCNDQVKRLLIKRKPDNTADIPVPEPKRQILEENMSIDLDEDVHSYKPLEPTVVLVEQESTSPIIPLSPPRPVSTSPSPVSTPPRPVATVRPTGAPENKIAPAVTPTLPPPPKILNKLLAKKAEAKIQNQGNSSNSTTTQTIGTPTLRILPNPPPVPALVPAGLMLTPAGSTSNIGIQRPPNPVYHTVNGYCIDLNSAAQQDMYRLPNGKIIQVRRQPAVSQPQAGTQIVQPGTQIVQSQSQIQTQPQIQMIQPATFQTPQFIQQLQSMGATIVQQLVPQQTQVNVVNKIPPLMLRPVHGNLTVENSHVQLGHQVTNTVQAYQHMNAKIKTFTNSSAYKSVKSLTDIKDLTMHLTYLLNYSIGRLQSIRKECAGSMKIIETEIGKQNKIDGDECEIIETNVAPVITLDSEDEADEDLSNIKANLNNTDTEFVEVPMASSLIQQTEVSPLPPIPHINIRNKILLASKGKIKTPTTQQNIIAKYSKLTDKSDIVIRKIKTEPKPFVNKTGTKLVKLYK